MTENRALNIGGLLLAAGGSSRLGQPKQLLNFKGKTLIRRAAETLVESNCDPIVVVLGAEIERSTIELSGLDMNICINKNWQTGMSSSIISGLNTIREIEPNLVAVVITLCDQPHVTSADIDKLIEEHQNYGTAIVAARYGKITGVPALFSKELFSDLLQLEGEKGARNLMIDHDSLIGVQLDGAALDIDTIDDLGLAESI